MPTITIENGPDNKSTMDLAEGDKVTIEFKDGSLSMCKESTGNGECNIAQGDGCIAKQVNHCTVKDGTTVVQQSVSGSGNVISGNGNVVQVSQVSQHSFQSTFRK